MNYENLLIFILINQSFLVISLFLFKIFNNFSRQARLIHVVRIILYFSLFVPDYLYPTGHPPAGAVFAMIIVPITLVLLIITFFITLKEYKRTKYRPALLVSIFITFSSIESAFILINIFFYVKSYIGSA
jgi:hypothetical protein